ncbi:MAG: hypothetical protein JRJ51_13110 [Deltaproteobacteria bacterium]|nr:hypothetical protein [Deltaproteobacteria bacterium]
MMDEENSTIAFTRNGEPVGVMMTPRRYEALLETIEILADKDTMTALEASEKDFRHGRVYTDKAEWKSYLLKGPTPHRLYRLRSGIRCANATNWFYDL